MYADRDALETRFSVGEIANLQSMSSEDAIDRALLDAANEIDMFVGTRYSLPINALPNTVANLERIACDIARYRLYMQQPTDEVRQRYDDAIKQLQMIASGKVVLQIVDADGDVTEQVATSPNSASTPQSGTYQGVFNDDTLSRLP